MLSVELYKAKDYTPTTYKKDMNISYNRDQLTKMKIPQLKELCIGFNLKKSGKKDILIDRIIQHTSEKHIEKPTPDSTVDLEFENKIWPAYSAWFSKTNYKIYKQTQPFKWDLVSRSEIQETFNKYDYSKSPLRNDSLVPVPTTRTEQFIEMFFQYIGGEWDEPQNDDGEWTESDQNNFIAHMKAVA